MNLGSTVSRVAWRSLVVAAAGVVFITTHVPSALFVGTRVPAPPPACDPTLPGREVPMLSSPHIPFVSWPHIKYNSVPPTSGPHLPWVVMTGIYTEPIPNELLVHVLEHGHINIQYAPSTPPAQVAVLRSIALRFPRDTVLVPYPALASGVAVTAWGRIEILRHADQRAIIRFIIDLRGRYDHGWSRGWASAHGARITVAHARIRCQQKR